jgi:hypothetical protein
VEEYEKKHQDKFSQFLTKYQSTVQEIQKQAADKENIRENCLKRFFLSIILTLFLVSPLSTVTLVGMTS